MMRSTRVRAPRLGGARALPGKLRSLTAAPSSSSHRHLATVRAAGLL
jgi:hypothetical protein